MWLSPNMIRPTEIMTEARDIFPMPPNTIPAIPIAISTQPNANEFTAVAPNLYIWSHRIPSVSLTQPRNTAHLGV